MRIDLGLAFVLLVACTSPDGDVAGPPDAEVRPIDANIDATSIHEPSGLPCDVADVLGRYCTVCHTSPPVGLAPRPLLTLADLTQPVTGDPTRTIAQLAFERMFNHDMPPLPSAHVTPADLATFQAWVNAGTPAGTTACPPTTPYDGPTTCSTRVMWTGGDTPSSRMHPGTRCIACHTRFPMAPRETLTGTVYRTIHEPDDCNGGASTSDPVTITVLDANSTMITAVADDVGNFRSTDPIVQPLQWASVSYRGLTRVMAVTPLDVGITPTSSAIDCNRCHDVGGTGGAPGRIVIPQ